MNKETQPTPQIERYETVMRSGKTMIYSQNETNLSAGGNVVVNADEFVVNGKATSGAQPQTYLKCTGNNIQLNAPIENAVTCNGLIQAGRA